MQVQATEGSATVADVYVQLAGRVGMPQSRFLRTVFARLLTPQDAELLLALPAPVPELAARFKMTPEEVQAKLDELVRKGVAIPSKKGEETRYFCVREAIQFHDASIHAAACNRYDPVPADILELWQRWRETEWFEHVREMEQTRRGAIRVIPLPGAVKNRTDLPLHEDVAAVIGKAERLAVVACPCRYYRVQQGKCDKPVEVCLSLREAPVQYILDRGIGREITVEEGLAILQMAEDAGLVPTANEETDTVRYLCFCCTDCCIILRPGAVYGYDVASKSRFRARVEADQCNGCQECVERCQFEAISMQSQPGTKKLKAVVDAEACWGCGACVVKCERKAIRFDPVEARSPLFEAQGP